MKQTKLIMYLADFISAEGHAPSFEQMAANMGIVAVSNVHRMVHALKDEGLVEQPHNKRRALTLTDLGWELAKRNDPEGTGQ